MLIDVRLSFHWIFKIIISIAQFSSVPLLSFTFQFINVRCTFVIFITFPYIFWSFLFCILLSLSCKRIKFASDKQFVSRCPKHFISDAISSSSSAKTIRRKIPKLEYDSFACHLFWFLSLKFQRPTMRVCTFCTG